MYFLYKLHYKNHYIKKLLVLYLLHKINCRNFVLVFYKNNAIKFKHLFQNREIALSYLQQDQFSTLLSRLLPSQYLRGTEAANVLYHFSGGHPALAKELCSLLEGILHRPELWHDWLQKMDWTSQIPASCEEIWSYLNAQQRQAVEDYANGKLSFHQMPSLYKMSAIFPKGKFFSPIFRTCVLHWGKKIKVPGLRIDPQKERVFVHGQDITEKIRNRKEFCLLFCMYEHRGKLCTYEELLRHCWPNDKHFAFDIDQDRPRIQRAVNRLCQHVDPDRKNPKYIISRPGKGYMLEI